jgi:hypothetical protein
MRYVVFGVLACLVVGVLRLVTVEWVNDDDDIRSVQEDGD